MTRPADMSSLFQALVTVDDANRRESAGTRTPDARVGHLLRVLSDPSDDTREPGPAAAPPASADDQLLDRLRRAQRVLADHPVAARAAISALIAEGRRFAVTPEGQRWQAALVDSPLVRRGRAVWEALRLPLLAVNDASAPPSSHVETFLDVLEAPALEPLLARLFAAHGGPNVDPR
jgi:hypothetical protein